MKTSIWHTCILFLCLGLLVLLNGFTLTHAVTGWMTAAGALLLLLLLFFAWKLIASRDDGMAKRTSLILGGGILILQVAYVFLMENNIRYDAYWTFNQAIEMLETHRFSPTISNEYFTQVPNNYGHTLVTYWFLSLVKLLGCPASFYMRAVQLFNVMFIDLSLLFVFLSIREIKGWKSALFFLLFCAISPFTYVWTLYYYTATTSMVFACAAVYLWLCIRSAKSRKKACLLAALMGILCITGFKVRATSLIAYIAIFLYWSLSATREGLKKHAPAILVFLGSVILAYLGWKGIIAHYVPFDTTDTALPVTHFMMMGAQWDGSYNYADLAYTVSLPTAEAKLQGTLSVIQERLTAGGLPGILELLKNKQLNCWVDGTDFATYESSLCSQFGWLHPYIIGSKKGLLTEYCQMLRVLQLLLVCVSCIFAFVRKKADGIFLLALNLLGGMAFQLLWETSPTYSIPFTFFAYALVCDGAERLAGCKFAARKAGAYVSLGASLLLTAVTCFTLIFQSSTYLGETHILDDFVVNQHVSTDEETTPRIQKGQTWRQTFQTEDPFNVVQLYYANSGVADNTSLYELTLADEAGNIYHSEQLNGNATGYDLYYEIYTDLIVPEGLTQYSIEIESLKQDGSHYLNFTTQDTSYVDLYPYGQLSIDGEEGEQNLCFRVLDRHAAPLATKKEYCAVAALLLILELFVIFRSLRLVKASGLVH